MPRTTGQQKLVLKVCLDSYLRRGDGKVDTMAALKDAAGIRCISHMYDVMMALEKKGWMKIIHGKKQRIEFPNIAYRLITGKSKDRLRSGVAVREYLNVA